MKRITSELRTVALAVSAASWIVACGGDGPSSPSNDNLHIRLTDDHTDELEAVLIFFVDLTIKPEGGPVEREVPIVLEDNPQDLLELGDEVVLLASGSVEPGTYEFIRINLDEDQSHVIENDGSENPLKIPSQEFKILGKFEVTQDGLTTVTLDFDAEKSLLKRGNGGWLLKPVIAMAK